VWNQLHPAIKFKAGHQSCSDLARVLHKFWGEISESESLITLMGSAGQILQNWQFQIVMAGSFMGMRSIRQIQLILGEADWEFLERTDSSGVYSNVYTI
jgi:hypothetical protein